MLLNGTFCELFQVFPMFLFLSACGDPGNCNRSLSFSLTHNSVSWELLLFHPVKARHRSPLPWNVFDKNTGTKISLGFPIKCLQNSTKCLIFVYRAMRVLFQGEFIAVWPVFSTVSHCISNAFLWNPFRLCIQSLVWSVLELSYVSIKVIVLTWKLRSAHAWLRSTPA